MDRRAFSKVTAAFAALSSGLAGAARAVRNTAGPTAVALPASAPAPAAAPALAPAVASAAIASGQPAIGVNLSGLEWAESGMRYGGGTLANLNYSVPRRADIAWLAANGYTRSRLPIKWEMLQPMLHDTVANAATRAAIGEPGAFNLRYAAAITSVLDAHAAAGTKCIIDLHNYCRYRDFVFQPDGSVIGLQQPANPMLYAYTTDNAQVRERIFALAPGATLKLENFLDIWLRMSLMWKDHPGFGGYGLMNEPYQMPAPGDIVQTYNGGPEDLMIWPTYAQAAITLIRSFDPVNPIYLGGNYWSAAMMLGTKNPAWPLAGANLVYEVHMYLDAGSTGQHFDYDAEVALGYNAGLPSGPINLNTGVDRLKLAVDWAQPRGLRLAVTETGMPIDDPRWQEMFSRFVAYGRAAGVEFFTWHGGNHWAVRNGGINHAPGWHQNKTLEPSMSGPLKASAGIDQAVLFDDGPGWAPSRTAVTITVYVRGALSLPLTVTVSSSNGGTFSKTSLTIPAGANGQASYTFTAAPNTVTTLSYRTGSAAVAPPPPRRIHSLTSPVQYAATNLADAAMALVGKYGACKWNLADGFTDYALGAPAADGQPVRAIADSGYGSSPGNAMEMLNWVNDEVPGLVTAVPPVLRVVNGRKASDHGGPGCIGFLCRKSLPVPVLQPNPRNRVPYGLQDPHFVVAAVSIPGVDTAGVVFQASHVERPTASDLRLANGQPQASFVDALGATQLLTSPLRLVANVPAVLSFTCAPGLQQLRVNGALAASGGATFAATPFDQMLLGWGFTAFYPRDTFGGAIYVVITGRGAPTAEELSVLERYVASIAGVTL